MPRSRRLPLASLFLFLLNALVAHRLFTLEYSAHFESNEGTFIAIARLMAAHPTDLLWWPFWDAGIPFVNTYLPLLHAIVAAFSRLSGASPALSFHAVSAFFYCAGPVTLFLMAAALSRRTAPSFLAALLYSLTSLSSLLIPAVAADAGGLWNARRLQILGFYGEGPHIATLAFLPLAILFLHYAIERRTARYFLLTGLAFACVALTNAFGAVDLLVLVLCLAASLPPRRIFPALWTAAAIGLATYLIVCPVLPPSLLQTIRANSPTVDGDFRFTSRSAAGLAALALGFLALWLLNHRLGAAPHLRFFSSAALVLSGIPLLGVCFHIYVVPQPHRYQPEMEMALCLLIAFLASLRFARLTHLSRAVLLAALLVLFVRQTVHCVRYARRLIQPAAIAQSSTVHMIRWIGHHYGGQRVMVAGSASYLFNDFTDTPQLHGGHNPNDPNWVHGMILFTIASGMNAGSLDAANSILWLKAFGAQAVTVPGPSSLEYSPPYANPHKFDGVLPVVWEENGDKVYSIPNRSSSLAHVIPAAAAVSTRPINGLDTVQTALYVSALDDPSLPAAPLRWIDLHAFSITTTAPPAQAVSIQITYVPGWHASANGRSIPITHDALGLILLHPACHGPCQIEMSYDGGRERSITLLLSLATALSLSLCLLARLRYPWRST